MGRPLLLALAAVAPFAVSACGGESDFTIDFAARAGSEEVSCGASFPGLGTGGAVRLRDFRLYVSNVRLVDADGAEVPLTLEDDGVWQQGGVALLDFEDGSAECGDSGTAETRTQIVGTAEIGEARGLRFTVGVPFAQNHFDSATAPSPLNLSTMFWNWRGGYKFMRIDLRDESNQNNFNIHLGATACMAATPVEAPAAPCGRPNRVEVSLDDFDPAAGTVILDLAGLLSGVDTSTNTNMTPPGCMSAPSDPNDCTPVFGNLGLDFSSGQCTGDCAGQGFVRGE